MIYGHSKVPARDGGEGMLGLTFAGLLSSALRSWRNPLRCRYPGWKDLRR